MMDASMDRAILETFPMLVASQSGQVQLPSQPGTRFIAGNIGLIREVSTDWLVHRKVVAEATLPYGAVQTGFAINVAPPVSLWREFAEQARKVLPNECAAVFVLNTETKEWRLAMREATYTSPELCRYVEPEIDDCEVKVVDIHSHGHAPAFFSRIDDIDDRGGIKVSAVIGNVSSETPLIALRLVVLDDFYQLHLTRDGDFIQKT